MAVIVGKEKVEQACRRWENRPSQTNQPPILSPILTCPTTAIEKIPVRKDMNLHCYAQWAIASTTHWKTASPILANRLSKYNELVGKSAAKWAEWLQVQMNTNIFDSIDLIRKYVFYRHPTLIEFTNAHPRSSYTFPWRIWQLLP